MAEAQQAAGGDGTLTPLADERPLLQCAINGSTPLHGGCGTATSSTRLPTKRAQRPSVFLAEGRM